MPINVQSGAIFTIELNTRKVHVTHIENERRIKSIFRKIPYAITISKIKSENLRIQTIMNHRENSFRFQKLKFLFSFYLYLNHGSDAGPVF